MNMIDLASLTLVDYGILLVLIISSVLSILRGMTREFLGLVGWVIAVLIANIIAPHLEPQIDKIIPIGGLSAALAWAIPFAASVIMWFVLASIISPGLKQVGLGSLDRWLGVIFGLTRGFGIVLAIFISVVLAMEGQSNLPDKIKQAQSIPTLSYSAFHVARFLPSDYQSKLIDGISYRPPSGAKPISQSLSNSVQSGIETSKEIVREGLELLPDEKPN